MLVLRAVPVVGSSQPLMVLCRLCESGGFPLCCGVRDAVGFGSRGIVFATFDHPCLRQCGSVSAGPLSADAAPTVAW